MPLGNVESLLEEAVQARQRGDLGRAENGFRRVLSRMPDHSGALYELGLLDLARARFEQAAAHFRKAIGHGPATPQMHGRLGFALAALGRAEEARKAGNAALRLQPDSAEVWILYAEPC